MLIIYDKITRETVSISGFRGQATKEMIDSIKINDLPETQAEYRIYDQEVINQAWQALDAKDAVELVFDGDIPVGIQIIDLPDPEPEPEEEGGA